MTAISDWQFELDGVPFGVGQDVAVSKFERGGAETRGQDQPSEFGDWLNFGTDRKTPGLWSWELYTNLTDGTSALAALGQLEELWDAEDTRLTVGEVLPLRYTINGRTRRVYGRPRRFTATPQDLTPKGRIDIVADFQLADTTHYADEQKSSPVLRVGAADLTGTGIVFPITFPVMFGGTAGSPASRNITVGGTRRTWLTATFTGPITNPYLIVAGTVFQLEGVLGAGEQVIVSGLPWQQGIYRPGGTTAPLTLDSRTLLDNLRVAPGTYLVTFGGIDNTGTASCVVAWRDAFGSH